MLRSARFADYRSPLWEAWRDRERDGTAPVRHCGGCGFSHRTNDHAPRREAMKLLPPAPIPNQEASNEQALC